MGLRTVEMTFDDTGNPTIHVKGVAGPGCKALTKDIVDAFGGKVLNDTPTPEMRLQPTQAERQAHLA